MQQSDPVQYFLGTFSPFSACERTVEAVSRSEVRTGNRGRKGGRGNRKVFGGRGGEISSSSTFLSPPSAISAFPPKEEEEKRKQICCTGLGPPEVERDSTK